MNTYKVYNSKPKNGLIWDLLYRGTFKECLDYFRINNIKIEEYNDSLENTISINHGQYAILPDPNPDISQGSEIGKEAPQNITSDDQIDFHNWVNNLDKIPEKMAHKAIRRTAMY